MELELLAMSSGMARNRIKKNQNRIL